MSTLDQANVAIIVFAMPSCDHCEEYLPRLYKLVEQFRAYGHPFVILDVEETQIQPGQIPIVVLDSSSQDAGLQAFADQYGVTGMPTTVFLTRSRGFHKIEGAVDDAQIHRLLATASQANQ